MFVLAYLLLLRLGDDHVSHLVEVDFHIAILVRLSIEDVARGVVFDDDIQEVVKLVVGELNLQLERQIVADELNLASVILSILQNFVIYCRHDEKN